MKTITIPFKFNIEDSSALSVLSSATIDKEGSDFINFEESMDLIFQTLGYKLNESKDSDAHKSVTRYYVYTKIENEVRLKALVSVRVSDHFSPARYDKDGNKIPEYTLRNKFVAKQAKEIANKLDSHDKYLVRSVNIVFNNTIYKTYDDALEGLKSRLDKYESLINV